MAMMAAAQSPQTIKVTCTPRGTRSQQAARVREILNLVGLAAFADKHPRELSGGQRKIDVISISAGRRTEPRM